MKKEYINPTTNIINIETIQMIAASGDFNDVLNDAGVAGEDALARDLDILNI